MSKTGKTILLVEDDAAIIETLTMFLRYEGYEVLKARSVERALDVLETTCPDLVLLDYMLQDDTGDRVVAFARRKYGYDTKIMLVTAVDDAEGRARDIAADGVLAKPFELDVLLGRIRDCVDAGEVKKAYLPVPPKAHGTPLSAPLY